MRGELVQTTTAMRDAVSVNTTAGLPVEENVEFTIATQRPGRT